MKCPQCGQDNEPGVAICAQCDAIIDPSFLGDDYTHESDGPADLEDDAFDGEDTPADDQLEAAAEPAARRRRRGRYVVGSADDEDEDDAYEDEGEDEGEDEIERQLAELRAKRARNAKTPAAVDAEKQQAEKAQAASGSLGEESSRVQQDVEQSLGKISAFIKGLEKSDKIVLGGALGMFLFPLFPWITISGQGDLSGLEVGGWFLLLLAGCVGSLVYLRQDPHWQQRENIILYVQSGVVVLAVLFLLVRMFSTGSAVAAVDPEMVGTYSVGVGVGLILSLLATIAAGAGTFLLLRDKVLDKS
jgi:hypothetical protein